MLKVPLVLWRAPEINPINHKARSIPALNPINVYGRVFTFAWFGFMIAFWSWYAFPPLLTVTIAGDLQLTPAQIANSNIISLVATLLVRVVAGPASDRFGPRYTFAACLLAGSIPTALAGAVTNASGLMALRFFIGILGGSFVPCQTWTTLFFDKNVVGTANAFTAGLGNSGGGITYFLMPAIFDSLVYSRGLSTHVAWRVAFIVPFIAIVATAIALVLLCPDSPTGKWSERHLHAQQNFIFHGVTGSAIVDAPEDAFAAQKPSSLGTGTPTTFGDKEYDTAGKHGVSRDHEAQLGEQEMIDAAQGEVIRKPSLKNAIPVVFSLQTLVVAGCYFCSFGAELAINSILGAYYLTQFPYLLQTGTGKWAAMFGLLNVVFRPLGGIISDFIYRRTSVWGKKYLLHTYGIITGIFLIAIGVTNSKHPSTLFGLVAGMAFFLEGGNGANFSLVPHVHPAANGIVSGVTGACGNFGGIIFAIIFRYQGAAYGKTIWIIGVITIAINLAVSWIKPIPQGQIGGH